MRDRLTAHYVYYDGQHGYEALGHNAYSQRPFIEITKKLALYEDTGYTPEEVKQLKTENIKLREVERAARAVAGFGSCHDENSCWSLRWLARAVDAYQRWRDRR